MGVERPDQESVSVNVRTLGDTAATLDTLRGMTDWTGTDNAGVPFGTGAAFSPAHGLADAHDRAVRIAWTAVGLVEQVSEQYAEGVAQAADRYGATDRHSADAIDAAARGMTSRSTSGGER